MNASLRVLEPGLAATIQDAGRGGYQRFGVPVSGALDKVSLALANRLVGNADDEAAIEVLAAGLSVEVCADRLRFAIAGTVGSLVLETAQASIRMPAFQTIAASRTDILRFPAPKNGAVYYIAVGGGFNVPPMLGSRSTYRRAALGGFHGRALQTGDVLPIRSLPQNIAQQDITLAFSLKPPLRAPRTLRVMRGPNANAFTTAAFETLLGSSYKVTLASDRMGLRLEGKVLQRGAEGELPSQGTTAGGLQVPADGQPILLLADRQTTGGYPRIATVIGADLAAAGRLAAGMSIGFEEVTRDEALRLLKQERDWLAALSPEFKPIADAPLSTERLLGCNLISGVTAGIFEP